MEWNESPLRGIDGEGDVGEQLRQIREYLSVLARSGTDSRETAAEVLRELSAAVRSPAGGGANGSGGGAAGTAAPPDTGLNGYGELRGLLLKTAEDVVREDKRLELSLGSRYLARSDFGTYFENARVDIGGTAVGIEQLYSYSSGIRSDFADVNVSAETYVKTGLLYYEDGLVPVYGVGVGDVQTRVDEGGRTVLDRGDLVGTFTPSEIAFWKGGVRRLYLTEDTVYLPRAELTAASGTFSGTVNATAGNIGGCVIENGMLRVPAARIGGVLSVEREGADEPLLRADLDAGEVSLGIFTVTEDGRLTGESADENACLTLRRQTYSNQINAFTVYPQGLELYRLWNNGSGPMEKTYGTTLCDDSLYFSYRGGQQCYMRFSYGTSGGVVRLYGTWTGTSGYAVTSDREYKYDIEDLPEVYDGLFDRLRPVRHKYRDGASGRYHLGFIAQEVEQALYGAGIPTADFGGFLRADTDDGPVCMLRYEEFIPLCVREIQRLKKKVEEMASASAARTRTQ